MEKIKVGENEFYTLYKTPTTQDIDYYAVGKGLKHIKSFLVESKTDENDSKYMLVEVKNGKVICSSTNLEGVAFKLDVLNLIYYEGWTVAEQSDSLDSSVNVVDKFTDKATIVKY
jgi:hypothetical protein